MADIVVGVDGSEQAQAALRWALEEARLRQVRVAVIHAYVPNPSEFYGWPGALSAEQLDAFARQHDEQAQRLLAEVVRGAGDLAEGVDVRTEAVRGVYPPQALIERSAAADLVVVGTRGRGGFKGLLLGSVSQQVAQHAQCPVVIVGSGA